jgi:uncharacterized protein YndB with AHSA1/START domain
MAMAKRNEKVMGGFSTMVSRSYDASPEQVFRAWTDPASVRAWLGMGGLTVVDPREDGLFYIGMPVNDKTVPHYGRYLRIETPRVLEFTWVSEHTGGLESVVLLEFIRNGKQTDLKLTHDGLPSEDKAIAHRGGWTKFLESLVPDLAKQAA